MIKAGALGTGGFESVFWTVRVLIGMVSLECRLLAFYVVHEPKKLLFTKPFIQYDVKSICL